MDQPPGVLSTQFFVTTDADLRLWFLVFGANLHCFRDSMRQWAAFLVLQGLGVWLLANALRVFWGKFIRTFILSKSSSQYCTALAKQLLQGSRLRHCERTNALCCIFPYQTQSHYSNLHLLKNHYSHEIYVHFVFFFNNLSNCIPSWIAWISFSVKELHYHSQLINTDCENCIIASQ